MSEPSTDPLSRVAARCRTLGVPLTVQRRATYSIVAGRHDHPTADQVHAELQQRLPGVSKATAYRTLDKLVELGLVRRVSHSGAVARFDAKVHRHHHLVCDRCGAVRDLESKALDQVSLPDVAADGFELRDFSVLIHGRCRACARGPRLRAKARSEEPPSAPRGKGRAAGPRPSRPRRKA